MCLLSAVNLYDHAYGDFAGDVEAAVRRDTYGEDIGQSSWMTAADWLAFADQVRAVDGSRVLEVGSGSGGPAVYLAERRRCHVTGIDINAHGIANGERLAEARGVASLVSLRQADASRPLPFGDAAFDAVLSNDAMCHIANRGAVLREWRRVLRPGGRMLFTDAMVITGVVSHEELAIRSSIGFYVFVPPGENERLIAAAGLRLIEARDVTDGAAAMSRRRHDAREARRDALVAREGEVNFAGLQRFLACVQKLSEERRLSRYAYLAERL